MTYGKTLICQDYKLMLFALVSLDYHAINHKTPIIPLMTYNSMLLESNSIKYNQKMINTYLKIQC